MAKILTVVSVILAGVVVAGMRPPLSAASVACIILLMAGAVVVYHEMGPLDESNPRKPGQADGFAPSASWNHHGVIYHGVEWRPSDSNGARASRRQA